MPKIKVTMTFEFDSGNESFADTMAYLRPSNGIESLEWGEGTETFVFTDPESGESRTMENK